MSNDLMTGNKGSLLSPENFEHSFRIARMMAATEMVPKSYRDKPADILIAMEMGISLGMGAMQAVQTIAVINGKPCVYGDGMLAICSGHPEFEDIREEPIIDDKGKTVGYTCTVSRRGRTPVTHSFTIEQATVAGLWKKQGPWTQYPERMLQMRARGFALRGSFVDALNGVGMVEEVRDYEIKDITPKNAASEVNINNLIANKSTPKINAPVDEIVDKETGEVINE